MVPQTKGLLKRTMCFKGFFQSIRLNFRKLKGVVYSRSSRQQKAYVKDIYGCGFKLMEWASMKFTQDS